MQPEPQPESQPDFTTHPYRGRLAPSPTGLLHIGHARTFWTAFERARQRNGTLILRIDDLDPERSKPKYTLAAIEDLLWLGIEWQSSPAAAKHPATASASPCYQSQRLPLYHEAFRKLLDRGHLYPCHCSRKELATAASAPHESQHPGQPQTQALDDEPIYPGTCRHLSPKTTPPTDLSANWRFRVTDGAAVEFHDHHLGPQRFVAGIDFGDFLVWRRDNVPSYQLACAVDDASMAITEVVRGADLLKSTARQILLYRALGLPAPDWYHCSLVAGHNGQRLAKRFDSLALKTLRARGLTPAHILSANFPIPV